MFNQHTAGYIHNELCTTIITFGTALECSGGPNRLAHLVYWPQESIAISLGRPALTSCHIMENTAKNYAPVASVSSLACLSSQASLHQARAALTSLMLRLARKVATRVYSNWAPALLPHRDSHTTWSGECLSL